MQTYLLYQHGKGVNISKDFAISYGACRHSDYHERIHASQIGRCEGRTGADESKGAVKKGDDLGGHGVCQKGNKTSEQYIGIA